MSDSHGSMNAWIFPIFEPLFKSAFLGQLEASTFTACSSMIVGVRRRALKKSRAQIFFLRFQISIMKNKAENRPDASKRPEGPQNLKRGDNNTGEKEEKKLPGEYPPQEDIMNRRDQQRVGLDVDNFSRTLGQENLNRPNEPIVTDPNDILEEPVLGNIEDLEEPSAREMERPVPKNLNLDDDNIQFATGNESDVTSEDLQALGPKDLSMDMGEDEELKNRVWPVDMAGKDLDVPGSEGAGDTSDQANGTEDEENDFYSLGGDRHEDNLEGK
jgi:hypothetical protein